VTSSRSIPLIPVLCAPRRVQRPTAPRAAPLRPSQLHRNLPPFCGSTPSRADSSWLTSPKRMQTGVRKVRDSCAGTGSRLLHEAGRGVPHRDALLPARARPAGACNTGSSQANSLRRSTSNPTALPTTRTCSRSWGSNDGGRKGAPSCHMKVPQHAGRANGRSMRACFPMREPWCCTPNLQDVPSPG
jgi:hypothetical protein